MFKTIKAKIKENRIRNLERHFVIEDLYKEMLFENRNFIGRQVLILQELLDKNMDNRKIYTFTLPKRMHRFNQKKFNKDFLCLHYSIKNRKGKVKMKELEEFFKNIKRIADGIETIAETKEDGEIKTAVETACSCLNAQYEQSKQERPVQAPIGTSTQAPLPVSNIVEAYTQDQLATAMGRAVDAGKQPQIIDIIASFGVSSLVELPQERYNDLVLKLKEIGVDV